MRVRLRSDPGRIGILSGRSQERAGKVWHQVVFADGPSYQPEYEIEAITEENEDPYILIEEGRFGRVSDLRRNLSHIQLSGRLANLVYSMDTTNTDFYAYQYKPVLSFLESPSNGLLIADEVGLGKTIEAGLIWTELRSRYDARRLIVICPAMLREKWKAELWNRFGIEAAIIDAKDILGELKKNKNEIPDGKAIICSFQGIRPPRKFDEEDQVEDGQNPRRDLALFLDSQSDGDPIIDLLIIDEAHYLRNPETQTARIGQLIRAVSEYVVLLTATPINLRDDDLFYLLNLIDPDTFYVKELFPQVLEANEPLIKARVAALTMNANEEDIKSHLLRASSHRLLMNNIQLADLLKTPFTPEILENKSERVHLANRIERINLLRHVVTRTRKADVTEWRVIRRPFTEFISLNELELDFYQNVTQKIRAYAQNKDISEGFLLASPQRQVASCMYAAAKAWTEKWDNWAEQVYEDFGVESDDDNTVAPLIQYLSSHVLPDVDLQALRNHDSKYEQFRKIIIDYHRQNPDEKIVVFSFFRGTLFYLAERLAEDGIKAQVLMGGMLGTKQQIIDRFRDDISIKILLSSEVASEGVDLQFCRLLVNYDLPWNPMKVEQRIGRLDRLGQESPSISIWNLCYANTIDQRICIRLFERLGIFERALGSMEAILGQMITSLTTDLLRQELTSEEETARIDQTAKAIELIKQDQDELEKQASNLIAHGGYILEAVQAAHDFKKRITEQDLVIYMRDYLNKYCKGFQFIQTAPDQLIFDVQLPRNTAVELEEFIRQKKLHGQTRLAKGELVRCEFKNKVTKGYQQIEQISQFHPFIRYVSNDLQNRGEAFYPLVAIALNRQYANNNPVGCYAFAISLWSFDGLRLEEQLRTRICRLATEKVIDSDESWELINSLRVEGTDWLSASNEIDSDAFRKALDCCLTMLVKDFEDVKREKENGNKDGVTFQVESATRHKELQLKRLNDFLEKYRMSGRTRMIAPTAGKIRKIKERFDFQVERLEKKSQLKSFQKDVCMGVIKIA